MSPYRVPGRLPRSAAREDDAGVLLLLVVMLALATAFYRAHG